MNLRANTTFQNFPQLWIHTAHELNGSYSSYECSYESMNIIWKTHESMNPDSWCPWTRGYEMRNPELYEHEIRNKLKSLYEPVRA